MKKILFSIIVGVGVIFTASSVSANLFTYYLDYEFTGGAEPAGVPPWLTAEIKDQSADTVRITMSAGGLTGNEFVSGWYFNWDFDVSNLTGADVVLGEEGTTGPTVFGVTVDDDGFNLGGPGGATFDIFFDFPESEVADRFEEDQKVVFDFMGTGLTALDFDVKDTTGNYYTAAHVQRIASDDPSKTSGKIGATESISAIPEPGTMLLLGAGLASLFGIRRFKFKK
jgi:hypothetical protein